MESIGDFTPRGATVSSLGNNLPTLPLGSCADGETSTAEWLFPPARDQQYVAKPSIACALQGTGTCHLPFHHHHPVELSLTHSCSASMVSERAPTPFLSPSLHPISPQHPDQPS